MYYLMSILVGSTSGFLPLFPMMAVFHLIMLIMDKRKAAKTPLPHIAAVYMLGFALVLVLSVTHIPEAYHLSIDTTINLRPFVDISTNLHQYLLNVVLFVPMGFLLPMVWRQYGKLRLTIMTGFLFSLAVELAQLLNNRVTDIDDLLMNTAGTVIGYLVFALAKRAAPRVSVCSIEPVDHWKWEPYVLIGLVWLSMLLMRPFVTSWLWGYRPRILGIFSCGGLG